MLTTNNVDAIRHQVQTWRRQGKTVALVPTMGNLHQGHIKLIEQAKKKADHVVASIFVNPMQFNNSDDLNAYPRTLAEDQQQLEAVACDLLFTPTPEIMYPKGIEAQTFVEVPDVSAGMCGETRPGHFRGVATIVCKLFNIVQPDCAFFGCKDYQQLLVIKTLVADLSLPIEIIGVDTVREASGLAMSSRNNYLTPEELQRAPILKQTLDHLADDIKQGSTIETAKKSAETRLTTAGFTPDYIEVRTADELSPVTDKDKSLVILIAAFLGKARLIDNQVVTR